MDAIGSVAGLLILPEFLIDQPGQPPKRAWGVRVANDVKGAKDLPGLQANWTLLGVTAYIATLFVELRKTFCRPPNEGWKIRIFTPLNS